MSTNPTHDGQPFDEEALVARVAARQSAHLGRPVPTDLDPEVVRRELVDDRDAAMIAVAVLRREGCGAAVPDAVEFALTGAAPSSAANMPHAVAVAILDRIPHPHRPAVWDAADEVLERFEGTEGTAALAELCLHHLADAVRAGITTSIAAELVGAVDHDGHPIPEHQIVAAAAFAAGIVYADVIARLQDDLIAFAGLR